METRQPRWWEAVLRQAPRPPLTSPSSPSKVRMWYPIEANLEISAVLGGEFGGSVRR